MSDAAAVFDFQSVIRTDHRKRNAIKIADVKIVLILTLVKLSAFGHNRLFICQTFYLKQRPQLWTAIFIDSSSIFCSILIKFM